MRSLILINIAAYVIKLRFFNIIVWNKKHVVAKKGLFKGSFVIKGMKFVCFFNVNSILNAYLFVMQNVDSTCDDGADTHDVIEESLVFVDVNKVSQNVTSNNRISFCHYWSPTYCKFCTVLNLS